MQAKTLNIPSYIDDPSYRYKMPGLLLKIEGRGNGIKTKIVNLAEVATALRVPPAYALKFLGYELGSQTNEGQSVINGSFAEPELKKHLDKFIEKYILCTNCKYPEMVLKVKHGAVSGQCNSCGTRSTLDNAHKLAAYILKNPPTDSSEFKGDKKAKDAKDTKDSKDTKKEDKAKDEKGEKDGKKSKHADTHHEKKEEKKTADSGEAKQTEKVKEVAQPITVVTFKDIEDDLIQKVSQVYHKHSSVQNFDEKPEEVKQIIQSTREIVPAEHSNKIPYIVFNAIFDINIAKEVGKNKEILNKVYEELRTPDREFDTLLNLEKFLLVRHLSNQFEKYVPTILKFFYDEDLLSDEFLVSWDEGKLNSKLIMDFRYQKSVDDRFKALARPILDWLKADEGDDDDEGGEGGKKGEGKDGGDDSDIDIDNI